MEYFSPHLNLLFASFCDIQHLQGLLLAISAPCLCHIKWRVCLYFRLFFRQNSTHKVVPKKDLGRFLWRPLWYYGFWTSIHRLSLLVVVHDLSSTWTDLQRLLASRMWGFRSFYEAAIQFTICIHGVHWDISKTFPNPWLRNRLFCFSYCPIRRILCIRSQESLQNKGKNLVF